MSSVSWGIVMTVKEPRALLLANLGWHLGTGATEIHVYLDDPDDPVLPLIMDLPGVRVVRCGDAHWHQNAPSGKRPKTHRRRQALNANHALNRCETDWLIHLDADEFLLQERPLKEELAVVRELDCELFFPVSERVFVQGENPDSIFSGVFRTSTKTLHRRGDGINNDAIIFEDHLPYLVHGLLGHSAGKCAVPRGKDYRIGIHWAFRGKDRKRAERYQSSSTRLLHFDGLTRLHWLNKLMGYAAYNPKDLGIAEHRKAQITLFQSMVDDPCGIERFHRELKEMDQSQLDRLRAFGLLYEVPFDPVPVLRNVLSEIPDFSAEKFDNELLDRYPERLRDLM